MNWKRALLTDSGGFQMVSLLKLAEITEEGVKFRSPYDDSECMLTPEHSMKIQVCEILFCFFGRILAKLKNFSIKIFCIAKPYSSLVVLKLFCYCPILIQ